MREIIRADQFLSFLWDKWYLEEVWQSEVESWTLFLIEVDDEDENDVVI